MPTEISIEDDHGLRCLAVERSCQASNVWFGPRLGIEPATFTPGGERVAKGPRITSMN